MLGKSFIIKNLSIIIKVYYLRKQNTQSLNSQTLWFFVCLFCCFCVCVCVERQLHVSFLKWVSPTVTGTAQLQSMVDFRKGILKRMKYHPDFPD